VIKILHYLLYDFQTVAVHVKEKVELSRLIRCILQGGVTGRTETMCPRTNVQSSQNNNVSGLIHPCHYMHDTIHISDQNDRDLSIKGHGVKGWLIWGPGNPEHSYGETSFRDVPSPHLLQRGESWKINWNVKVVPGPISSKRKHWKAHVSYFSSKLSATGLLVI